ncbi:Thoeris anti-defense Tad2 family protein [Clostridium rectalis]|uniref:Thoeris anti-defense Tad2 family protein n=1 Tax=Clostridium rectalis TaxID=2040295 RepID=UPI000F62C3A3|nr:MW1434 family type I TA system toxin [Clostridium rectalis]
MNIRKALGLLKEGNKIARKSWDKNTWIQVKYTLLESKISLPYIYKNNNGKLIPWVSSEDDILANDWRLIETGEESNISCSDGELFLALRKSFIASFIPPGGVFTGEKAEKIMKQFKKLLDKI